MDLFHLRVTGLPVSTLGADQSDQGAALSGSNPDW